MQIRLLDPAYTDRLAAYLQSVGQNPLVSGPDLLDLQAERAEIEAYVRVWNILYPDADVEILH
jgi:hypothetical protein